MGPLILVAAVLGAAIGSFLNVVVYRVPRRMSLSRPPSACPACGAAIRPWQNVPVLSFFVLRGRCRSCGKPISWRYPLVEAVTTGLFVAASIRFGIEEAAFVAASSSVLLVLASIDLEHRIVPNRIVIPSTAVAALWVVVAGAVHGDAHAIFWSLLCGAVGFGFLMVIALVSGGMGFGDVKLAALIGVVAGRFGWEVFALALFAGFVAGGLAAGVLLALGRAGRKDALPFAPALAVGALVAIFAGAGPVRAWLGS